VYSIMQEWFRESGLKPRRISFCGNVSVVATLVRKGVGVSLLPHKLLKAFIDEGSMIVLPSRSTIQSIQYNVAYLPTSELEVMDQIASFACEESVFFQNSF
jgi:DNA-binding transcriptional LysR family regulator